MPSSIVAAGIGLWGEHQDRKAQKTAQRRMEAAQERTALEQKAAAPGQQQTREFDTEATNRRLKGVQATMLASRQAQNASAGGNATLGA